MKRLDRLTAILIQLQSKKIVRAQDLADKFDVSLRTVYRDFFSLQEAGVPIGSQEGVGYFLVEGYHLPPVMFTEEEANALIIGAKLTESLTDEEVKKAYSEAVDKIRSVLPEIRKEQLDILDQNLHINRRVQVNQENPVLIDIQKALSKKKTLHLKYYSSYNGQVSEREVEPMGLVFYADSWHLMAWCKLREDYRDFRTDRIGKIRIMENDYDRGKHPGLEEHMRQLSSQYQLTEVLVRFRKEVIRFTANDKFSHGFVEERDLGDQVEMKFLTTSIDFLSRWLIMFDEMVEVISPDELKSHIRGIVQILREKYL